MRLGADAHGLNIICRSVAWFSCSLDLSCSQKILCDAVPVGFRTRGNGLNCASRANYLDDILEKNSSVKGWSGTGSGCPGK